jgi:glycosyltransferase involved in cell wall biosynthesis
MVKGGKRMRILYVSAMFDDKTYAELFTKEKKPMHAANKYHTLLSRGLAAAGAEVNTYSALPISRENCDRKFVKAPARQDDGVLREYATIINFPMLKHGTMLLGAFFKSLFAKRGTIVLYDVLNVSLCYGSVLGAKLSGKKCIGIITDLPQFMPIAQKKSFLKLNKKLIDLADGYIFLTKEMDKAVNPKHKPHVVLEGHVDANMATREHKPFSDEKKKVLYAGSLRTIYGIKNLCEAFADCSKENEELHIYGDGDYVPEMRELIKSHANIVYHGNRPNTEVVEGELESTLLVNPRPTEGEYTKFSFPSKTLEYMVSGTPVLSARLQGIPEEYDEYLYYFDDKDPDGLKKSLREILDKPTSELAERGARSRSFALNNKSNVSQASRIIDLIGDISK